MGTRYIIQGKENAQYSGEIFCNGAKNIAVKAMITSLLSKDKTTLHNIPNIGDVHETIELLESLNVKLKWIESKETAGNSLEIDPSSIKFTSDLNKSNRTSISLLGILSHLANGETVELPKPAGCNLGNRGIDFHINIYEAFGFKFNETETKYSIIKTEKKPGQYINLPYPSVGATETALFMAVLTEGQSIIENMAVEPEVLEIISMLQLMGANIQWTGNRSIKIIGVKELRSTSFNIVSDRLETVSYAILSLISDGKISVKNISPIYIHSFIGLFSEIGGKTNYKNSNDIEFSKNKDFESENHRIKNTYIESNTYPHITTDQLAQITVALGLANGISVIHETVFDNRAIPIKEMLNSFGVEASCFKECMGPACRFHNQNHLHSIAIAGRKSLTLPDRILELPKNIRCAHSYILLASATPGKTILEDKTDSIIRGYGYDLVEKLRKIGMDITSEPIQ